MEICISYFKNAFSKGGMIMNAKRLARGQIWHWNDPIYGDKKTPEDILPVQGENTTRYSRYVLIVQQEPRDDAVIVVPLSTKAGKITDYRIPIWGSKYLSFVYVRIDRLFNVCPSQLNSYICTVDADTMKMISAELIRLLLPEVLHDECVSTILENRGLPLEMVCKDHNDEESQRNSFSMIGQFIKQHIATSLGETSAMVVYEAYRQYCSENKYDAESYETFVSTFCTLLHISKEDKSFKNVKVVGITLNPNEIVQPAELYPTIVPVPASNPKGGRKARWTTDERQKFINFSANHSTEEIAKEFKLSRASVYKYRRMFAISTNVDTADTEEEPAEEIVKPGMLMQKVKQTVSTISNFIKEDMITANIYAYTNSDLIAKQSAYISKDNFYKQISAAVYYSLLGFLEIKENYNGTGLNHPAPEALVASREYCILEEITGYANNGQTPYQVRQKLKAESAGISQNWLDYLRDQLSYRLNLEPANISNIVEMIGSTYCQPK